MKSVITGVGHYIPTIVKTNADFSEHTFYDRTKERMEESSREIVDKFEAITGITERRYAVPNINCSDMAAIAGKMALEDAGVDPETIDQIIVAHDFGDIQPGTFQSDMVPSIASRVKHLLGIKNPNCVAFDMIFGCPGWLQAVIQAHALILSGTAKRCLVIGSEVLSRVLDSHDRDSMLFSDGAGAIVLEATEQGESGILATAAQSHCEEDVQFIEMGTSYHPQDETDVRFAKMKGRKVYEYALKNVPPAMLSCLNKANVPLTAISKIFLHQANEKVVEAIVRELYQLEGIEEIPEGIAPMNIHLLGNSSVATIPTLYSMVCKGEIEGHSLQPGDLILFASVGAGMNINAVCYKV